MSEFSFPWTMGAGGDDGPYSADDFAAWQLMLNQITSGLDTEAVVRGYEDELVLISPAANTVRLGKGGALVQGRCYRNTATKDFNIPTPAGATRDDLIVLRCTWGATQTVRAERLAGTEGAGWPAITQTLGVLWEVPIWAVSITIAGAITLDDQRCPLHGRTRCVFVPAVAARNITDGTDIARTSVIGWPMPDAKHCAAWGQWLVPADLTLGALRGAEFHPIYIADATGDVYYDFTVDWGSFSSGGGQAYNAHSESAGYIAEAVTADLLVEGVNQTLLGSLLTDQLDLVSLTFDRDATDPLDTIGDTVNFLGWEVHYGADS